jgi:DNA modification methylase
MIRLFHSEALEFIDNCNTHYDLIFMDPPDNIGLDYGPEIDDNRDDYYDWLRSIIMYSMVKSPILWLSYYHKHDLEVKSIVRNLIRGRTWDARTLIWNFNFGQYRDNDCSSNYRPILRLSRANVTWDCDSIRVESERMRLGDSRAAGPKVPGDVWTFPRITGNHPERRKWIKTQHPEKLLERIVKMSKGSKVLELFTGSGTMIRVAKRLKFDLDTVELSSKHISILEMEQSLLAER